MSTNTTKNNGEQQTNFNRSSYAHLLAGGYENREKKYIKYMIFIIIGWLVHLEPY